LVKAKSNGAEFTLNLSKNEAEQLGFSSGKEFDVVKAKEGVWILLEKEAAKTTDELKRADEPIDETEQRIIGYLKKKQLRDRVEGTFEKLLNENELKKFSEMLKQGKVEKFKLNEKYKKAVYQLPEKSKATVKKFDNTEKPFDEFTLEKDGFLVVKNELRAKKLSDELSEQIREGKVRGTKSFDGMFYIIDSALFDSASQSVLAYLKTMKQAQLQELSNSLSLTKTLVKIACTLLAEEGQILEKRRETYRIIE